MHKLFIISIYLCVRMFMVIIQLILSLKLVVITKKLQNKGKAKYLLS